MRDIRDLRRVLRSFINRLAEERNTLLSYPAKGPNTENVRVRAAGYDELIEQAKAVLQFVDFLSGKKDNDFADYFDFLRDVCRVHSEHGSWVTRYGSPNGEAAREWAEDAANSFAWASANYLGEGRLSKSEAVQGLLDGMPPFVDRDQRSTKSVSESWADYERNHFRVNPPAETQSAQLLSAIGVAPLSEDDQLRRTVADALGIPYDQVVVINEGGDYASS